MSKKLRLQRGEIATIITIASLLILGASTLVSSVFLSKNKQTTSTKAANSVRCCIYQSCTIGGKKGKQYKYYNVSYPPKSTCGQWGFKDCSSITENNCVLVDNSSSTSTTDPIVPINTPTPKFNCTNNACSSSTDKCAYGKVCHNFGSGYCLCIDDAQLTITAMPQNTQTTTLWPTNPQGHEQCLQCCIKRSCGSCSIGGNSQARETVYWSYNCQNLPGGDPAKASCGYMGSSYFNCPADLGVNKNRSKCESDPSCPAVSGQPTLSTTPGSCACKKYTPFHCYAKVSGGNSNLLYYSADGGATNIAYKDSGCCQPLGTEDDLKKYCTSSTQGLSCKSCAPFHCYAKVSGGNSNIVYYSADGGATNIAYKDSGCCQPLGTEDDLKKYCTSSGATALAVPAGACYTSSFSCNDATNGYSSSANSNTVYVDSSKSPSRLYKDRSCSSPVTSTNDLQKYCGVFTLFRPADLTPIPFPIPTETILKDFLNQSFYDCYPVALYDNPVTGLTLADLTVIGDCKVLGRTAAFLINGIYCCK